VNGEGYLSGSDNMPVRSEVVMGTIVTIHVVRDSAEPDAQAAIDRAFHWFHEIEARCSRFSDQSELNRLTAQAGIPVTTSAILFEAVQFALMVAEETDGAFDPTVGHRMEARGFDKEHRTGLTIQKMTLPPGDVSYRDVQLDPESKTITLQRPLRLDLGAVAKGLAVDIAARELEPFRDFAIDAGGDLYLGGVNPQGAPWSVGIRHPRRDHELIDTLKVSNQAVCTSGDYERSVPSDTHERIDNPGDSREHHILDPRTGTSPHDVASATVVASGAMLADALATAVFVMGPKSGIELLHRMGVEGLIFTPELERYETGGLRHAA
jgi:thiamine biosynthesis lipoprotein